MRDPRSSIELKIRWAEKHIGEIHKALRAFINSKPYVISGKYDAQAQQVVYYVVRAPNVPIEIPLIAGDVIQNLRTALDYLACSLVRANSRIPTNQTGFPIFNEIPTTPKLETSFSRKVKGMRQEAIDAIRAIKPYKGGDDTLWRLHRLNIIDKHRLLLAVGAASRRFNVGQHGRMTKPHTGGRPELTAFPLKTGDKLFVDTATMKVNKDIQFVFDIALNERGICEGEPLLPVLRGALNRIRGIVNNFVPFLMG